MGASSSKPSESSAASPATQHIFTSFAVRAVSQCLLEEWNICNGERAGPGVEVEACANWPRKDSDTPVRFSQGVLDGLQGSGETDSSREKSLELLIQSRVAKELKQLEEHESRRLREIEEQISALAASPSSSALVPTDNKVDEAAVAAAVAAAEVGAYQGHDGARLQERLQAADRLGRESVQREVEALRQRLAQRKAVRQLDQSVEKARRDVVECLRVNDRRPLDCWREVDAFKREVARLEETFVSKAL